MTTLDPSAAQVRKPTPKRPAGGNGLKERAGLIAICALCALYYSAFDIRTTPIFDDTRYYLYFSARVAQGDVPYRDFFEVKTPLSFLLGGWLHRIAGSVGAEPVLVLRAAFLAIGALTAVAMFVVQRRLAKGNFLAGFVGVTVLAALPVLGLLLSVGVLPKALMALFSLLSALAVAQRHWFAAGACGAFAFLDWQVGGLVIFAAALAGVTEAANRARSVARVFAGAGVVLGLVVSWFAAHDGLKQFFGQTLGVLFDRSVRAVGRTWLSRPNRIAEVFQSAVPDGAWLPPLAAVGLLLFVVRVWRDRRDGLGFLTALGTYHFGLMAFSLLDFQYYDDLFILLYSFAFFAGIAVSDVCRLVLRRLSGRANTAASAAICALLLLGVWRNATSRSPLLKEPTVTPETRLSDQIQVAERVMTFAAGRRVAFLGAAEIPLLANVRSVAPIVYWNTVAYSYYGRRDELYLETRGRIMQTSGAELLVGDRTLPPEPGDHIIGSDNGAYWVVVRKPF